MRALLLGTGGVVGTAVLAVAVGTDAALGILDGWQVFDRGWLILGSCFAFLFSFSRVGLSVGRIMQKNADSTEAIGKELRALKEAVDAMREELRLARESRERLHRELIVAGVLDGQGNGVRREAAA